MQHEKISITLAGIQLKSPIIIGASDFISDYVGFARIAESTSELGAFVTKTFTLNPRIGNRDPITACIENNVMVASGIRNKGLRQMLKDINQYNRNYNGPLLIPSIADDPANIQQSPEQQITELAQALYDNGITIFELNLSCPNLNTHQLVSHQESMVYKIIAHIKNNLVQKNIKDYKIIAKLAGNIEELSITAKQAEAAGADIITILPVLRATGFYTGLIDYPQANLAIGDYLLGNTHGTTYGSALGPITRYLVMKLKTEINLPIIASGGCLCGINNSITEKTDGLIQTIMSGASAVAAVSPFYPFSSKKLQEINMIIESYKNYLKLNRKNQ